MKLRFLLTSIVLAAALTGMPAGAAPIVDQIFDSTQPGALSNQGPANQQISDDFFVSSLTSLGSVTWFGRYEGAIGTVNPTDFTIRIFSDAGGTPPLVPFIELNVSVAPTVTGLDFGGSPWFSYTANFGGAIVGSGTFWISILENDASTALSGSSLWRWAETSATGERSTRLSDSEAWLRGPGTDMAFTINSSVPEPSTWLLLGTGLVLAAFRKRAASKN